MKSFELLKRELASKLKAKPLSILIIFISLILSFAVLFPVISYLKKESERLTGIQIDRCTFKFNALVHDVSEAKSSLDAFERIAFLGGFPDAVDYPDPSFTVFSDDPSERYGTWHAYFGKDRGLETDHARLDDVIEGRWFTDEAYAGRSDIAAVSKESYPDLKPGDTVTVNGYDYEVIALTQRRNVLPWRAIRENNSEASSFAFNEIRIQYVRPLTQEEKASLSDFEFLSVTGMDEITGSSYFIGAVIMIAISCGLLFIIIMNVRSLFVHIFRTDAYRYTVMKSCGAGKGRLTALVYVFPVIMTTAAFIIGMLIYALAFDKYLSEKLQYECLTAADYLIVFACTLVFLFIVLLPSVLRLIGSNAADKRLWR